MEAVRKTISIMDRIWWVLRRAGWSSIRNRADIVEAYKAGRGDDLFPEAERFIRGFGGIDFGGKLQIWSHLPQDHFLTSIGKRISEVLGLRVVPLASSNYLCRTSILWLDEQGRFYDADEEGMIYLGEGEAEVFTVLLMGAKPKTPPPGLKEKLERNYKWENGSFAGESE